MSNVTIFYLISSKFFVDLLWEPHIPVKDPPAYYFFDLLDLITGFLDFLDLKTGF